MLLLHTGYISNPRCGNIKLAHRYPTLSQNGTGCIPRCYAALLKSAKVSVQAQYSSLASRALSRLEQSYLVAGGLSFTRLEFVIGVYMYVHSRLVLYLCPL